MITTKFEPCVNVFFTVRFFLWPKRREFFLFSEKVIDRWKASVRWKKKKTGKNESQPFQPDSSEKWWYYNKNTVFNIYCVASRHPIFSFFSFLESTIIVTWHISDFSRHRKIKVTDFSEASTRLPNYDHYKILSKLASGQALTLYAWDRHVISIVYTLVENNCQILLAEARSEKKQELPPKQMKWTPNLRRSSLVQFLASQNRGFLLDRLRFYHMRTFIICE